MQSNFRHLHVTALLLVTALLSACGGGSGGDPGNGSSSSSSSGGQNNAPVATNGSLPVKITAERGGTLQASDADGDTLSFAIVSQPTKGTITSQPDANGNFTYEPHVGATPGNDSFTFRVNDGNEDSNLANFTINLVNPVEADNSLSYTLAEGGTTTVAAVDGVIDNAINPIGEALTVTLLTAPALDPSFILETDGGFTYIHDGSENHTDSFTYQLEAANGDRSTGTATINVTPVNDPPTTIAAECGIITDAEIHNDTLVANDIENDTLTYDIDTQGSKGIASIDINGNFQYTPNTGTSGVDTFTVIVDDGQGGTATRDIHVNIAVRVMPMGDSITEGVVDGTPGIPDDEPLPGTANRVGYRKRLKEILENDGYSIDFVGTRNVAAPDLDEDPINGDPNGGYGYGQFSDFESEGHGGRGSAFFDTNTATAGTWLTPSNPDIVLLHIGTNDFKLNNSPPPIADNVENTVNNIFANSNASNVFVARIFGQHPSNIRNIGTADVSSFNIAVANAVSSINNAHMVDLNSGFDYTTVVDNPSFGDTNVHPSVQTYNTMAQRWADAMIDNNAIEQCPQP